MAFGHTHIPWTRVVDGIRFLNTGSVGRPKDGDPRAGYALVTAAGDGMSTEFVRVDYDLGQAVRAILRSALPDEFAAYLEAGGAPSK